VREIARIIGLAWMVFTILGGLAIAVKLAMMGSSVGNYRAAYHLIPLIVIAAIPGYPIFRWGSAPYRGKP
jgi:hypothetical protein